MTRLDASPRSIMAATTVLIARTISISAGVGARIVDSASDEQRTQMAWVSAEQGNVDASDKACGCLPQPPNFDLPPPPMPPPSFGDFGSISDGVDWAAALTSDPMLESCQKDVDRWTTNLGDGIFIPKWTGEEGDDGNEKGPGDDFGDLSPDAPRFFGFLDQPLTLFVIVGAAVCVLFLSICILACYCRRKSSRQTCFGCCLTNTKKTSAYPHRNGGSTNGHRRSKGNGKFLAVVEASSPATTTTIVAPKVGYLPGYSLSNGCDSTEEMSDGEHDHFLGHDSDFGRTSAAKDWSYNAMRSTIGTQGKATGVHTRINSSTFNGGAKYGAIPTDVPSYERNTRPAVMARSENGKILTRASPPVVPHPSQLEHSSLLYDSHNPIYEEISLHDKSSERCAPPRRAPRRSSEGVGNYVDSGASSANSDANFQFADGEEDEEDPDQENVENEHPPRYYAVDGAMGDPSALAVINSPCCSSGRSECDECCAQEDCVGHDQDACPFSPRPRHRQPQDLIPAPSMTPSPIRNKFMTNKINRSTQSGESCLGNDDFYSNCCECSGRESGYGTEGRRHPTPQRRAANRYGDSKTASRKTHTMDLAGNRGDSDRAKYQSQVVPSSKFHTMRHDRIMDNVHRLPAVMNRQVANGGKAGSPRLMENGNGLQLQAMSSDNMHLHKSAFV